MHGMNALLEDITSGSSASSAEANPFTKDWQAPFRGSPILSTTVTADGHNNGHNNGHNPGRVRKIMADYRR